MFLKNAQQEPFLNVTFVSWLLLDMPVLIIATVNGMDMACADGCVSITLSLRLAHVSVSSFHENEEIE